MNCNKCGFDNVENAKYCSSCGNELNIEVSKEDDNRLKGISPFILTIINILIFTVLFPVILYGVMTTLGVSELLVCRLAWVPCMLLSLVCVSKVLKNRKKFKKWKFIFTLLSSTLTFLGSCVLIIAFLFVEMEKPTIPSYETLNYKGQTAYNLIEHVYDSVKNPYSLQIESIYFSLDSNDDVDIMAINYMAENSFGAMKKGYFMYHFNIGYNGTGSFYDGWWTTGKELEVDAVVEAVNNDNGYDIKY